MLNIKSLRASLLATTVLALGFTGCGTAIKLSEFQPSNMQKAKHIPSKEKMMDNGLPKVIIMDISNNGIQIAQNAKLGKSIATNLNTKLSQAKSVKLIKRVDNSSYSKMLKSEIKAAELGKEIGADIGQADYIITGQLSNASYEHSFHEGYYYYVKTKNGVVRRYRPPSISYKACAVGNVKVFKLPSLDEADSFEFNDCSSKSVEARNNRDIQTRDDSLVRAAGAEAVDTVIYPLKNFFAKKGYIYEMRKDGDKIIVKTTLGTKYGAKEGDEVNIYEIEDLTNSLTGETKQTETIIAKGTISNQLNKDFSWVIVDEVNDGKEIKAGDYIKIQYKEGFFSKFKKAIK